MILFANEALSRIHESIKKTQNICIERAISAGKAGAVQLLKQERQRECRKETKERKETRGLVEKLKKVHNKTSQRIQYSLPIFCAE